MDRIIQLYHRDAPGAQRLMRHFRQSLPYLNVDGRPARKLDVFDGNAVGAGPVGFSAALLPLFQETDFGERQRRRLTSKAIRQAGYYSRVLSLFGTAWDQRRYAFGPQGQLRPAWEGCP